MKKLIFVFLCFLLFSCHDDSNEFRGVVYEDHMITMFIILPTNLLNVGDTLFFVVKNDTVIFAQTDKGEIYMRRYKSESPLKN